MEAIGYYSALEPFAKLGVLGLVIFLWWYDNRQTRKIIACHKKDLSVILDRYENDMAEMREMYKNNVELVKDYKSIAGDLKEVVVLNIRECTKMKSSIDTNQFCPLARLDKDGVIAPRENFIGRGGV